MLLKEICIRQLTPKKVIEKETMEFRQKGRKKLENNAVRREESSRFMDGALRNNRQKRQ